MPGDVEILIEANNEQAAAVLAQTQAQMAGLAKEADTVSDATGRMGGSMERSALRAVLMSDGLGHVRQQMAAIKLLGNPYGAAAVGAAALAIIGYKLFEAWKAEEDQIAANRLGLKAMADQSEATMDGANAYYSAILRGETETAALIAKNFATTEAQFNIIKKHEEEKIKTNEQEQRDLLKAAALGQVAFIQQETGIMKLLQWQKELYAWATMSREQIAEKDKQEADAAGLRVKAIYAELDAEVKKAAVNLQADRLKQEAEREKDEYRKAALESSLRDGAMETLAEQVKISHLNEEKAKLKEIWEQIGKNHNIATEHQKDEIQDLNASIGLEERELVIIKEHIKAENELYIARIKAALPSQSGGEQGKNSDQIAVQEQINAVMEDQKRILKDIADAWNTNKTAETDDQKAALQANEVKLALLEKEKKQVDLVAAEWKKMAETIQNEFINGVGKVGFGAYMNALDEMTGKQKESWSAMVKGAKEAAAAQLLALGMKAAGEGVMALAEAVYDEGMFLATGAPEYQAAAATQAVAGAQFLAIASLYGAGASAMGSGGGAAGGGGGSGSGGTRATGTNGSGVNIQVTVIGTLDSQSAANLNQQLARAATTMNLQ